MSARAVESLPVCMIRGRDSIGDLACGRTLAPGDVSRPPANSRSRFSAVPWSAANENSFICDFDHITDIVRL